MTPFPSRAAAALAFACIAFSQAQAAPPTPDSTYDAPDTWLCRPGRTDLCSGDQAVTAIAADGTRTVTTLKPDPNAPIDCFYVYPTISLDPNANSPLKAGPGEQHAVEQQFAPFASVCRAFAPLYRQVTLAGLGKLLRNEGGVDPELPVEDVRAAWRHYLANDNKGRGVVLIGHSQGTRMLTELIKRDIEGQPQQKLVVSAMLVGINLMVPAGAETGGTFKTFPVCRQPGQTGCAMAFSTFRASEPPPGNARFGRSNQPGTEVACTDPVALSGQPLRSMLWRDVNLLGQPTTRAEWRQMVGGTTGSYIDMPGYLNAACVKDGSNSFLSVSFDPAARGTRAPDIPGDIVFQGKKWDDWGLHLVDMNIAMGNLLEIVRRQGAAWK